MRQRLPAVIIYGFYFQLATAALAAIIPAVGGEFSGQTAWYIALPAAALAPIMVVLGLSVPHSVYTQAHRQTLLLWLAMACNVVVSLFLLVHFWPQ